MLVVPCVVQEDVPEFGACKSCGKELCAYSQTHPCYAEFGPLDEWDCDVCGTSFGADDPLYCCASFDKCDWGACAKCQVLITWKPPEKKKKNSKKKKKNSKKGGGKNASRETDFGETANPLAFDVEDGATSPGSFEIDSPRLTKADRKKAEKAEKKAAKGAVTTHAICRC